MEGNSLAEGNWEAMDLTWQLREGGVFGEEAWTREINGQTLDITNSARPSHSTQQATRRPRRIFCTNNSGEDMDDGDSNDEDDDGKFDSHQSLILPCVVVAFLLLLLLLVLLVLVAFTYNLYG